MFKLFYVYFFLLVVLVSCNKGQGRDNKEIAAVLNNDTIYLNEVDNSIQQIIYEKLNEIYYVRQRAIDRIIEDRIQKKLETKYGLKDENLINFLYSKSTQEILFERYINQNNLTHDVPNIGRVYAIDKFNTEIGYMRARKYFKDALKRHLLDSLKKSCIITNFISRPPIPKMLLNELNIFYINKTNRKSSLVFITDPDCSNCNHEFPIIDNLIKKYSNTTSFGFVLYSSAPSDKIRLLYSAAYQNKFLCTYRVLNSHLSLNNVDRLIDTVCIQCNVNKSQLKNEIRKYDIVKEIEQTFQKCQELGIYQTPSIILNNTLQSSILDFKSIEKTIKVENR